MSAYLLSIIPIGKPVSPLSMLIKLKDIKDIEEETAILVAEFLNLYVNFLSEHGYIDIVAIIIDMNSYEHCVIQSISDRTIIFRAGTSDNDFTTINLFVYFMRAQLEKKRGPLYTVLEDLIKSLKSYFKAIDEEKVVKFDDIEFT